MNSFCIHCKEHTQTLNPSEHITSNGRKILKGTCGVCGKKKAMFVKSDKTGGRYELGVSSAVYTGNNGVYRLNKMAR